ncbi:hypothetical protein BV20DRAFT_952548 [Pilatotrama ljubarskyi]|nr:hypothetical protein BV20DRAFT_952548 [Pilatotrama ljubarskyi]
MLNAVKVGTNDFVQVPKLEVGHMNWVLYKDWLLWATDAKGVLGHLNRTSKELAREAKTGIGTTPPLPPPPPPLLAGRGDSKQLVTSMILDSLMKVCGRGTARVIWEAIATRFEKKSCMVTVDLR